MDRWGKVLNPKGQVELLFYLRSFLPSAKNEINQDFDRIEKMYFSLFESTEDHNAIQSAMANAPTMGLFLIRRTHNDSLPAKKQPKRVKEKQNSVLDEIECLSAVTYFRNHQDTVVLWLGTTLNEPPVESVNVTWRNSGFATYLLCLLIKQHTGISDDMSKSTLSIQASPIASNDACRFYQRLGFSRYEKDDNGLSQTSTKFQSEVKRHPYCGSLHHPKQWHFSSCMEEE